MRTTITTLAWGLFCACSWTWCIGMYLPALMIDRFGWMGFVIFAVPNILGCAGFGYILARRATSEAMVQRHGPAMVVFSLTAIAFHMFFTGFVLGHHLSPIPDTMWLPVLAAAIVLAIGLLISLLPDRAWLAIAAITYCTSVIAFAFIGFGALPHIVEPGAIPMSELIWLSPIVLVGFLLCPYLDLTFHRALQQTPSRHAFAVFGVAFAVMIIFTCFLWRATAGALPWIGLGHILGQSVFTVGAHLREIRLSPVISGAGRKALLLILPIIAAPIHQAAQAIFPGDESGDDLYLRFLVFYGLAFPAYVLMFIGPWRPIALSRRALWGFASVIILLAPLYELGFIHQRAWLLAIPTGAVVLWAILRCGEKNPR